MNLLAGITATSLWSEVAPYFEIELYDRDGSARRPRARIEVRHMPEPLRSRALRFQMPCVACGRSMRPFRCRLRPNKRSDTHGIYYAAACDLKTNIGCSRGNEARDEYRRVRAALGMLVAS